MTADTERAEFATKSGEVESLIESCRQRAVSGMEHFLVVFSFVPDDKLNWAPAPTAKSAIRIAAHTSLYAGRFAQMLRDRRISLPGNLEAWLAERDAEELMVTDRIEMERIFREGTAEVLVALDALSPGEVEMTLDSGQGWSMPMTFLMNLPGRHATDHSAQIDYLQTCWGDQEVHF